MVKEPRSCTLVYSGGTEAAFYRMVRLAIPIDPGPCGRPIVHDDGRIEYPEGQPSEIEGYERIEPRVFRPAWPSCRWRALTVANPDGCLAIQSCCQHPLAPHHLQQAAPADCRQCEFRSAIAAVR
jgi:hypothetical protein